MKHKYNVGDKLVYIYLPREGNSCIIENVSITRIGSNTEEYYETSDCREGSLISDNYLYTPVETIEFLTNYINKEE